MNYFGTLFCSNSLFNYYLSNIPAVPAYGVYISQLIRYSRLSGSYRYFFERGLVLTRIRKLLNQGFLLVKLKSSLESLTITTMTWLTATEYLCQRWPRDTCRNHSWHITGFVTRVTPRVFLVEQERLTLPEYMSSIPVFSGVRATRSFAFCVVFCRSLFVLFLLAIVLSVLLQITDSDYPVGMIFILFLTSSL